MSGSISVTILSGSLGAGKTTLVNHLLSTAGDRELAVLVNDMGAVNVDAELVAEGSELDVDDGVTELSNGCICCEKQDDLETAVVRLARERSYAHLVVESSGLSEPAPVARLFTTESRVAALYDVDTLVTVLNTPQFLEWFDDESTPERQGSEGDRPLSDLLVDQVEVSNVVLLNKADQCSAAELDTAEELVGALQPDAETIRTEFSAVDPDQLLGVGRFKQAAVDELPGWKRALEEGDDHSADDHSHHDSVDHGHHDDNHNHRDDADHHGHTHPDEVYGVSSFTYRRRRPFDPERLATFFQELPSEIVRAKGTVWLAGRDQKITVSQAGPSVRATAQGPWIASLPEVDRQMYRSNRPELDWHDDHGDRRTELVFIGTAYDENALRSALDEILVAVGEAADSEDPFPDEAGAETVIRGP